MRPTWPLPTNDTALMSRCVQRKLTAATPPCKMLMMPAGTPACVASLMIFMDAEGTFSEGLRMKALPVLTAIGSIHSGIIAGKLKGAMPATCGRTHAAVGMQ